MDISNSVYTKYFPKDGIAFAPTGRIAEKYQGLQIVQWRKGVPLAVYRKSCYGVTCLGVQEKAIAIRQIPPGSTGGGLLEFDR